MDHQRTHFSRCLSAHGKAALGLACLLVTHFSGCGDCRATTWPTQRHDSGRTGATEVSLDAAHLSPCWSRRMAAPRTAWPKSARWDAYNQITDLLSSRTWDACYQACSDGRLLFVSSSTEDLVMAIDLASGEEVWRHPCGGPVRIAPTLDGGRLYFGSDDGGVYCITAKDGKLLWYLNPAEKSRRVIHNERVISPAPVRTGVVLRDGTAYFGCGLTTLDTGWIGAVDAITGKVEGAGRYLREMPGQTIEGPLTPTSDLLVVPRGRLAPLRLNRGTGEVLSQMNGSGGPFCIVMEDGQQFRSNDARHGEAAMYQPSGEKISSVGRGSSIAVRGERAYIVVDGQSVQAIERKTGATAWTTNIAGAGEVIVAGDTVFAGGEGAVTALSSNEGKVLWTGKVEGRALGLLVAGGHLVASTDLGSIHAFASTARAADGIAENGTGPAKVEALPLQKVPGFSASSLLMRYVFHRSAMADQKGATLTGGHVAGARLYDSCQKLTATLTGVGEIMPMRKKGEAMVLDGNSYYVAADPGVRRLPVEELTLEAFVRIDRAQPWGAMIGCVCDNGGDERGWVLGVRGSTFAFGLGTQNTRIDYATAPAELFDNRWHHLAGTYDGRMMRLFLDGREVAALKKTGAITYPDKPSITLGAFKDEDECFPMQGAIHEVRVWRRCLAAEELKRSHASKANGFPANETHANGLPPIPDYAEITVGPYARFLGGGRAEITWATASAMPTEARVIGSAHHDTWGRGSGTGHRVVIENLEWGRIYGIELGGLADRPFDLDTAQDHSYLPPTAGSPAANALVAAAVKASPNIRGLAAVLGAEHLDAAKSLAGTGFRTVIIEPDRTRAEALRHSLATQQWLGDHVAVIGCSDFRDPTLPTAFAAIVVTSPAHAPEATRFARPYGGAVWSTDNESKPFHIRPAPEGAASWNSQYGDAASCHYAGETLRDARGGKDLLPQWLGEPGPRFQSDRQNRKPSPLAANGRLFLQGFQRLLALDAFSGAILWGVETPGVARFNVPRSGSNWCCDDQYVYLAHHDVLTLFDGGRGTMSASLRNPLAGFHWGTVLRTGGNAATPARELLIGTAVKPGTEFKAWWGTQHWYDATQGESIEQATSDAIFAYDVPARRDAKPLWTHRGLIVQPTICCADGKVFFLERRFETGAPATRKLVLDENGTTFLVALDLETGREHWRNPVKISGPATASYIISSRGKVILELALRNGTFEVSAMDTAKGSSLWSTPPLPWEASHHGKQISRIGTQGELLYLRPRIIDLETGVVLKSGFPAGHTCGSYSLASQLMIGRMGDLILWNAKESTESRLARFRQDCWIGSIPACGMLLVPETGGGCSCGGWMEASIGLIPQRTAAETPD